MPTPLQGATFELRDGSGNVLLTATSDSSGVVSLGNVSPGTYTLVETVTPDGFIPGGPYTVVVSDTGDITINGIPLADFEATNYPPLNFAFSKTDSAGNPLGGAVFLLDDGHGTILQSTSVIDGIVTFYGVLPGDYELTETTPPFGYLPDTTVHTVHVSENGTISIDGVVNPDFTVVDEDGPDLFFTKFENIPQSPPPEIDAIRAGLIPVTGSGVPGSTVTVTWPDDSTGTTTVDNDGNWSITPTVPLVVGDEVSATQTVPNHSESEPVSETVQPASDPPVIDDVFEGDTTVTGTGVSGSTVNVYWPGGAFSSATVAGDNTWSINVPAFALPLVVGQILNADQTTSGSLPSVKVSETVQGISTSPVINNVYEGDPTVSGTGIAGSVITVTWPDSSTSTTTVGAYGTWVIDSAVTLSEDDTVSATQTTPGRLESPPATTTVLGVSEPPTIDQIINGQVTVTGTGIDGATVTVSWPAGGSTDVTVGSGGTWSANSPVALITAQVVSATQTEPGKQPSPSVSETVVGISQVPEFLTNGLNTVTGTGIPGATINFTWADDSTDTLTVDGDGNWVATSAAQLVNQTVVHASQTEPGKLPSATVPYTISIND